MEEEYNAIVSELSKEDLESRCNLLMSEIQSTRKYLENSEEEAEMLIDFMKNKYGNALKLESLINLVDKKEIQDIKGTCKYWNRGYCRNRERCRYDHPEEDCDVFMLNKDCRIQSFHLRHRRTCKYWKTEEGCFRGNFCQYLHLATDKYEPKKPQAEPNVSDENEDQQEIKLLKIQIEKLIIENENKEYRIKNIEKDYEDNSVSVDEEN